MRRMPIRPKLQPRIFVIRLTGSFVRVRLSFACPFHCLHNPQVADSSSQPVQK